MNNSNFKKRPSAHAEEWACGPSLAESHGAGEAPCGTRPEACLSLTRQPPCGLELYEIYELHDFDYELLDVDYQTMSFLLLTL